MVGDQEFEVSVPVEVVLHIPLADCGIDFATQDRHI